MNGLTERDEYGNADIIGIDSADLQMNLDFDDFNKVTYALNRLAAYEDTGPTPENITYQTAQLHEWQKKCNLMHKDNAQLRAELEQVKAERDAAVEDLKIMALAMRESDELSEGCCFACICDAQNLPDGCILPYGECPGYETDDCFEWRGLEGQV